MKFIYTIQRNYIKLAFGSALLTVISLTNAASVQMADTIYTGGNIITINDVAPLAEAIAIKDGKILAVGSNNDVFTTKSDQTKVVNLNGKTLLPGFIDAHSHVFSAGIQAGSANLLPPPDGKGADIAAVQQVLQTWLQQNGTLITRIGWIIGFGYDEGQLKEHRHPNRDDLDAVSTQLPIIAIHQSGHLAALNSKALEIAGYNIDSKDPNGGIIRRRPGSKEPDGVLEEMAFFQVIFKVLSKFDHELNKAIFKSGIDIYASIGFTTAQEGRATEEAIQTEAAVAAAGELKIDVAAYPDIETAADTLKSPLFSPAYHNHFRIAGVKLGLDGSPRVHSQKMITYKYLNYNKFGNISTLL